VKFQLEISTHGKAHLREDGGEVFGPVAHGALPSKKQHHVVIHSDTLQQSSITRSQLIAHLGEDCGEVVLPVAHGGPLTRQRWQLALAAAAAAAGVRTHLELYTELRADGGWHLY
jgi:hypothetical protein